MRLMTNYPADAPRAPHRGASNIDPFDRRQMRWLYRQMRRDGVRRSTTRMYLLSAYHVGYRARLNEGQAQR